MSNDPDDQANHRSASQPALLLPRSDGSCENSAEEMLTKIYQQSKFQNTSVSSAVDEVPETEASVGRELDHRLCSHKTW